MRSSIIITVLLSVNLFSQKNSVTGFIVTVTNDTIHGELKDKSYYSVDRVKLYTNNNRISYNKLLLKEININSDRYIKSDNGIWTTAFFKKKLTGSVNLYSYKKKLYLGGFDTDLNFGRLKSSIKFYCDDYPNFPGTLKVVDKSNISEFIIHYNKWKENNPDSKSYFERNIHKKSLINFKISFLLPGIGLEFGVNENLTISSMLKNEFGYGIAVGWIINPFVDNQIRYYHNMDKRKENNKRTYKYSGNYFSLIHALFLNNMNSIIGFEYGWQRIIGKNWYYNLGIGAGKGIDYNNFALLYDLDLGYNF